MFSITCFPKTLKSFFKEIYKETEGEPLANLYFWRFVLGFACLSSSTNLSALEKLYGNKRTRQSYELFLENPRLNLERLLQNNAITMLRRLGWKAGEPILLVMDDTQIEKYGKKMEGRSKIFLHAEGRYSYGYSVFVATLVYRGVGIPFYQNVCLSKQACEELSQKYGREFHRRTLIETAVNCINGLQLPGQTPVVVLFDKYYLCSKVTNACEQRGFTYIGAVKSNRKFDYTRTVRKVGAFAEECLDNVAYWRKVSWNSKRLKLATRTGRLSKAGQVRIVFSRREEENGVLILATNRLNLSAEEIVKFYRNRWSIESFFKTAKQKLGMSAFRVLKLRAIESHLYLVMFAHQLLTHQAIQQLGGKIRKTKTSPIRLSGITETQSFLRRKLTLEAINKGLKKKSLKLMKKYMKTLVTNSI